MRILGRRPAGRRPPRRRETEGERAQKHGDEIEQTHHHEGLPDADRRGGGEAAHERIRQGRRDHGAPSESHDRHAGRHAAPVREPLDERRHGRHVPEAEPAASDDAVAQIDEADLVPGHAERGDEKAAAPAAGRDDADLARSRALQPGAGESRRQPQEDDRQRVDPAERRQLPVGGRGLRDSDRPAERQVEDADGVRLPDAQVDRKRRRRNEPAIEPGPRDDPLPRQQPRHRFPPARRPF